MPTTLPSAVRTLNVFEIFARERRELSNSDLARYIGVANSSCSDLLHTLQSLGYLTRSRQSRRFYPTGRLLETAKRVSGSDSLLEVARGAIEHLAKKTGQSAFLARVEQDAVTIIEMCEGSDPLRYVLKVGGRVAIHASSLGKAILGALPPEEGARLLHKRTLKAVTRYTVTEFGRLDDDVRKGRKRGWYEAHNEATVGVSALAVSGMIGGEPIAIAVAGPTDRIEKQRRQLLVLLSQVREKVFIGK